jgi:diadenosine tetraphosphatase ApaH/serine/threonine PP2A family protein phosphatase
VGVPGYRTIRDTDFSHFDTLRCLVGHSHLPFLCKLQDDQAVFYSFPVRMSVRLGNDRYIINPGSVGQPRDGLPTASYAIYDSDAGTVTHQRATYDIAATQRLMRDCCLPAYLVDRLERGL